jgi:hypothetical protein
MANAYILVCLHFLWSACPSGLPGPPHKPAPDSYVTHRRNQALAVPLVVERHANTTGVQGPLSLPRQLADEMDTTANTHHARINVSTLLLGLKPRPFMVASTASGTMTQHCH